MKFLSAFAALFLFLASALGQTQEPMKFNPRAAKHMSEDQAKQFWAQARNGLKSKATSNAGNNPPQAPGIIQVIGLYDDTDQYAYVRFASESFPANSQVCVGWRITTSTGDALNEGPDCVGNFPYLEVEIFRGSMSWASWSGVYEIDVLVQVNDGPVMESSAYIVIDGPTSWSSAPKISDAYFTPSGIFGANFGGSLVVEGAFVNPIVYYDGLFAQSIAPLTQGQGISANLPSPNIPGRALTICDQGQCVTQIVYKVVATP